MTSDGHRDAGGDPGAAPAARDLARRWVRVSREAAARQRGALAVHAQLAADVETLRGLVLEQVAPAGSDAYTAAASALSDALSRAAVAPHPADDAQAVLARVRAELLAAFDPDLRPAAQQSLAAAEHLAGLDPYGPVGSVPADPVRALGLEPDPAGESLWLGSGYLDYLEVAAASVGDAARITVVLRVAAAREALRTSRDPAAVRAALLSTLPPAEQDRVAARWARR